MGNLSNTAPGPCRATQKQKSLDIGVGISTSIGRGSRWDNGAVTLFPDADDVGTQPRTAYDNLYRMILLQLHHTSSEENGQVYHCTNQQ